MSLKHDMDAALGAGAWQPGLSALKGLNSAKVSVSDPRQLSGSADVDSTLRAALPHAARWDYAVGRRSGTEEEIVWVEIHPATSGRNISEMHAKLQWLLGWIRGTDLDSYKREVTWIASGRSAYNARSPQIKALAASGCFFAGGHLKL